MSLEGVSRRSQQIGDAALPSDRRASPPNTSLSACHSPVRDPAFRAGDYHSSRIPSLSKGILRIMSAVTRGDSAKITGGKIPQNHTPKAMRLSRIPNLESEVLLGILAEAPNVPNSSRRPRIGTHLDLVARTASTVKTQVMSSLAFLHAGTFPHP